MNVAILHSRAQIGVQAPQVTIEVFLSGGLPHFSIVGMAETAVRESKDRVRGAIQNSGFQFPQERITINLGPADMRKAGGRFDLAIALGILAASKIISADVASRYEYYGELALNGEVRFVPGILPAAVRACESDVPVFVPQNNAAEAALSLGRVFAARSLLQVVSHLNGIEELAPIESDVPARCATHHPDLADVRGQLKARRALEIAAAGGHNILLSGPPGTGKSMLAQRLTGILPEQSHAEALESATVASILGQPIELNRWRQRPYRCPHHTASAVALVGGGSDPRPGEISRAHNGVLFLDELPEFGRQVLEVLREPMETGRICISRAGRQAEFPARFQLVAAMNPCPCGYLGDPDGDCRCSAERIGNYRARISGPLLDRIDIQVQVPRPAKQALRPNAPAAESTQDVLQRVVVARQRQIDRSGNCNAMLEGKRLHEFCVASENSWLLLERAMDQHAMSARAHQRILRVARTITDLAGRDTIRTAQMSEALSLRYLDRRT